MISDVRFRISESAFGIEDSCEITNPKLNEVIELINNFRNGSNRNPKS